MNRVEKLIAEMCPDGVEFYALMDVAYVERGKRLTKRQLNHESRFPVYSGGVTPMGYFGESNQPANTVTMVKYGTAGFVNYIKEEFWANDVCYCIKPKDARCLLNKYLFYSLKSKQYIIRSLVINAIPAHLPTATVKNFRIPIPPLEIQQEIVRILDKFTELERELERELEARKRQYQYYRDKLLNFEGGLYVRYMRIGEICTMNRGCEITKKHLHDHPGPYPVYSSQTANAGVFGFIDTYDYDFESITWTTDGAKAGSVFYHTGRRFSITTHCGLLRVRDNNQLIPKFLYYILEKHAISHVRKGMGNPNLTSSVMSNIRVPVPSPEVQYKIVDILDRFDTLVHDLSIGLPAEIHARRKQYEYYRDRLLTFKETA